MKKSRAKTRPAKIKPAVSARDRIAQMVVKQMPTGNYAAAIARAELAESRLAEARRTIAAIKELARSFPERLGEKSDEPRDMKGQNHMPAYNIAIQRLLDEMPERFRKLPISDNGFPIPKFVACPSGKPDFRVIAPGWPQRCITRKLCWLCGELLGRHMAFVIGPMCAVNRVSSEPPSHLGCARFAVKACPFMANPNRGRDESNLPEAGFIPGHHLARNPGVSLIWVTKSYKLFNVPTNMGSGKLIEIGSPELTEWWARGRPATREEILASIDSGLPALRAMAVKEGNGAEAALDKQVARAMTLVPAGPSTMDEAIEARMDEARRA